MDEEFKNIQEFFSCDLSIKKILYNLQPEEKYRYNKESIIEYVDKLYNGLKDIEFYISKMIDTYFKNDQESKSYFQIFIKVLKDELINIGYDYDNLCIFYQKFFSNMSEDLISAVGNNCVGYTLNQNNIIRQAKSVNELLHVMHQSIINNEKILQSLPKVCSKKTNIGEEIRLYGILDDISKNIFDGISLDSDIGETDIIALKGRVIMMVRDVGHALSIEIEKENDKYYVRYFIPKICNVNMVNMLNGVKKVDDKSTYTVGVFESSKDELSFKINDFINKVPKDCDLFIEGGKLYNPEEQMTRFHM